MNKRFLPILATIVMIVSLLGVFPVAASDENAQPQAFKAPKAKFSDSVAFDISPTLRSLPKKGGVTATDDPETEPVDIRPDR